MKRSIAAYAGYMRELEKNKEKQKCFLDGLDRAYAKKSLKKEFEQEFVELDAETKKKINHFIQKLEILIPED